MWLFVPDNYIQKSKKSYVDSRARRNFGSINSELQDVQRIMVANIEEVLQRGEALSGEHTSIKMQAVGVFFFKCVIYMNFWFFILSSGHKSQQFVHIVKKVPEWCQIPKHPLYLCQGGCCGSILCHAHHLCAFLVALMDLTSLQPRTLTLWRCPLHLILLHFIYIPGCLLGRKYW